MTLGEVDVEVLSEDGSDAGDKLFSSKSTLFPVLPLFPPPLFIRMKEKMNQKEKKITQSVQQH